jgi:FkbM family methyltransferase
LIGAGNRVFSFEPQARVVKQLRRNIEFNALSNVEVFPFALSDTTGTVTFNVPPDGDEAFGSMQANGRFTVAETVEVETRRLDDVLHDLGNPKIGLIKLDSEGAELLILRGAAKLLSSPEKPDLIFEANETNCKPFGYCVFDTLQYVHSFGYQLRQIDEEDWIATSQ